MPSGFRRLTDPVIVPILGTASKVLVNLDFGRDNQTEQFTHFMVTNDCPVHARLKGYRFEPTSAQLVKDREGWGLRPGRALIARTQQPLYMSGLGIHRSWAPMFKPDGSLMYGEDELFLEVSYGRVG